MKKFICSLIALSLIIQPMAFGAWDKADPAGTRNASDIDLYVVANNTALEGMLDETRGFKNLRVVRDSATQVTVTADVLYLQSSGTLAAQESTVSEAIAITTSGASGLDTGVEASGTWYYIWIIRKSSDGTVNGLLSTSATSPTMPSGYDQKTLVSAVRNDGSSNFINFYQQGHIYTYAAGISMYSGLPVGSAEAVDLSSVVPSGLSNCVFGTAESAASGSIGLSNVSSTTWTTSTTAPNRILPTAAVSFLATAPYRFVMLTANTLYVGTNAYGGTLYVEGFEINKL